MQLLATGDGVVFDDRYPMEYRFVSYFARMAATMAEPFDAARHVGVTPFFFGSEPSCGPIPFTSDILDVGQLQAPLLHQMWLAWSTVARATHPAMRLYAEKLAVGVEVLAAAAIPLRVVDLVRDPRDMLASIRAFTAKGIDGFGRTPGVDEAAYLTAFVETYRNGLHRIQAPLPDGVAHLVLRCEDLVADLTAVAARMGRWLGIELDAAAVVSNRHAFDHHRTSASPEESVGRWRTDLTAGEADYLRAELAEVAGAFGYDL